MLFAPALFTAATTTRRGRNDLGVSMIFVEELYGFGAASLRLRLEPRANSEIFVSMTGTQLPCTDWKDPRAGSDEDGWSNAWFRELRIGCSGRPW